ncbi:MAG: hypothetical protein GY769_02240 [bacterium]|nr:hypothetical protein [bacterium]
MIDSLIASSSLPNLHPALVHFPLALWPLAAGFDVFAVITGRRWFDRVAVVLYALGTGLGWWAAEAGEHAAESFVDLPAVIEPEIAEHSDMAHYALYVFAFVLAVRLVLVLRDRSSDRMRSRGVRLGVLLVAAVGLFLLFETAEHGGSLVYEYGLGVSSGAVLFERAPASESVEGASMGIGELETDPAARLTVGDDGSLTWLPIARDREAVGTVLFPVTGFPRGAVEAAPSESMAAGLTLTVLDRAMLVFGSEFGDVRVEAELVLEDFSGTAGVAHHVQTAEAASWFETSTTGGAALRLSQGGSVLTLEEAAIEAPSSTVRIGVSVADGHRKGMLNGAVVVHGHIGSPDGGKVGLLFDGNGRVVVKRVSVEPID